MPQKSQGRARQSGDSEIARFHFNQRAERCRSAVTEMAVGQMTLKARFPRLVPYRILRVESSSFHAVFGTPVDKQEVPHKSAKTSHVPQLLHGLAPRHRVLRCCGSGKTRPALARPSI